MMSRVFIPMCFLAVASLSYGASREEEILQELAKDTVAPNEFGLDRISVQGGFHGGFGSLSGVGIVLPQAMAGSDEESMNRAVKDATAGIDAGVTASVFWNGDRASAGLGFLYSSLSASGKDAQGGYRTDATATSELVAGTLSGRFALGSSRRLLLRGTAGAGPLVLRRELNTVDDADNRFNATTRQASVAWMGALGAEVRVFPVLTLLAEVRYLGAATDAMSLTSGANGSTEAPVKVALDGDQGDVSRVSASLAVLVEFGLYR